MGQSIIFAEHHRYKSGNVVVVKVVWGLRWYRFIGRCCIYAVIVIVLLSVTI